MYGTHANDIQCYHISVTQNYPNFETTAVGGLNMQPLKLRFRHTTYYLKKYRGEQLNSFQD